MTAADSSDGATRLACLRDVPLAHDVERQWPQIGEGVRGNALVALAELAASAEAITVTAY